MVFEYFFMVFVCFLSSFMSSLLLESYTSRLGLAAPGRATIHARSGVRSHASFAGQPQGITRGDIRKFDIYLLI